MNQFQRPTSYEIMVEGVHAAAGEHEPIFYTKWFSIDVLERYFYHLKPDGSFDLLGRMTQSDSRVCVEMPFGAEEQEFDNAYTAEDYVTFRFASGQ